MPQQDNSLSRCLSSLVFRLRLGWRLLVGVVGVVGVVSLFFLILSSSPASVWEGKKPSW